MFWFLAALNWMTGIGTNTGKTFAEAYPLFMSVDNQYQTWWTKHLRKPTTIPNENVLPPSGATYHSGTSGKLCAYGDMHRQNP